MTIKKNDVLKLHNKIFNKRLLNSENNDKSLYNKFIVVVSYCDIYLDYIKECLISINEQNYSNYEVYIVNEGSKNIKIIDDFIINKKNYKILNKEKNEGAASSRWEFINFIQNNISKFSYNDIVVFIDGDDYLIGNDVFILINNKYLETKCWITCSDYHGIFSEEITQKFITQKKNNVDIRIKKSLYFPPLRTCKLGLLKYIKKNVFIINNNYIQKASDVALFTNLYELCGNEKTEYINNKLYYYRDHNNNSYNKNIYFFRCFNT